MVLDHAFPLLQKILHNKQEEFRKIETMQIFNEQKEYEKVVNKSMLERWGTVKKAVTQAKVNNKVCSAFTAQS